MKKPYVIAICQQKGGVGKTTMTINLAATLVRKGYRILAVDIDPQANMSTSMGYLVPDKRPTLYNIITNHISGLSNNLMEAIRTWEAEQVDYIPSNIMMAGVSGSISQYPNYTSVLQEILSDPVCSRYDYILIDCKPALDLIVDNALAAADGVIIPAQTEEYALDQLYPTFLQCQKHHAHILGIVCTMYDPRYNAHKGVVEAIHTAYPELAFQQTVSRYADYANSLNEKRSVHCVPGGEAKKQLLKLTDEIIARSGNE